MHLNDYQNTSFLLSQCVTPLNPWNTIFLSDYLIRDCRMIFFQCSRINEHNLLHCDDIKVWILFSVTIAYILFIRQSWSCWKVVQLWTQDTAYMNQILTQFLFELLFTPHCIIFSWYKSIDDSIVSECCNYDDDLTSGDLTTLLNNKVSSASDIRAKSKLTHHRRFTSSKLFCTSFTASFHNRCLHLKTSYVDINELTISDASFFNKRHCDHNISIFLSRQQSECFSAIIHGWYLCLSFISVLVWWASIYLRLFIIFLWSWQHKKHHSISHQSRRMWDCCNSTHWWINRNLS